MERRKEAWISSCILDVLWAPSTPRLCVLSSVSSSLTSQLSHREVCSWKGRWEHAISFFYSFWNDSSSSRVVLLFESLLSSAGLITIPLPTSPQVSLSSPSVIDIDFFFFFGLPPFSEDVYRAVASCYLDLYYISSACLSPLFFLPHIYPHALLDPEITAQTCWRGPGVCPPLACPPSPCPSMELKETRRGQAVPRVQ